MANAEWTQELKEFSNLKPRRSLAMEAAEGLREFILIGKLGPGVPVRERDLAEAFGISRTPLKEALRMLESEGLIEYGPTRRPVVADPSLNRIHDWLRVQGTLEALAGELCCANASDEQLEEIAALNSKLLGLRRTSDSLTSFRCDMDFHCLIVAASGNQALVETHATYNARLWRVRYLSAERKVGMARTEQQHADIVTALLARDAQAAADALRNHLRSTEDNIDAVLQSGDTDNS